MKQITRYDIPPFTALNKNDKVQRIIAGEMSDGKFVLFSDHEKEVKELEEKLDKLTIDWNNC